MKIVVDMIVLIIDIFSNENKLMLGIDYVFNLNVCGELT